MAGRAVSAHAHTNRAKGIHGSSACRTHFDSSAIRESHDGRSGPGDAVAVAVCWQGIESLRRAKHGLRQHHRRAGVPVGLRIGAARGGREIFCCWRERRSRSAAPLWPLANAFAVLVAGAGWRESADGLYAPIFPIMVRVWTAAAGGGMPRRSANSISNLRAAGLSAGQTADVRQPAREQDRKSVV